MHQLQVNYSIGQFCNFFNRIFLLWKILNWRHRNFLSFIDLCIYFFCIAHTDAGQTALHKAMKCIKRQIFPSTIILNYGEGGNCNFKLQWRGKLHFRLQQREKWVWKSQMKWDWETSKLPCTGNFENMASEIGTAQHQCLIFSVETLDMISVFWLK